MQLIIGPLFRFRRKHSGITGTKLHAGKRLLISSLRPSTWRRVRPQRRSSGGPNGGGGNRERAARTDKKSASSWRASPATSVLFTSFHLPLPPPPLLPCCRPKGMGRPAEGNGSAPAPPGHYRPHTCCLRMPTASPACLRGLTQPPLMGMSHFRHLARGVHMCCHAASELFWIFSVWLKYQKMSLVLPLRHQK